ncbi:MAG TPA: hypothetical protein VHI95_14565 [Acidimicrobiales bacterium]|nr:hypothetical protein [Acidimicrobiales bacterium]
MFGIDDIIGAFTGGGGSSSSSVTSNVNLTIAGLDKMNETITLQGGDKPLAVTDTIELKPLTVNLGGTDKPLAVTDTIELKPVTVTENLNLGGTDKPIAQSVDLKPVTLNENIDLKPVAVDTCQTLRLAPLPETGVRQPYHHHVGYTMFGVEYVGVTYHGESQQLIDSPQRPQVVERIGHTIGHGGQHKSLGPSKTFGGERGIRVRVLDPDDS